jgi:peroxiredoxin
MDWQYNRTDAATVFVFLAPDCAISQQCTAELNELYKLHAGEQIRFCGIVPGSLYSASDIFAFKTKYNLHFLLIADTEHKLVTLLNATTTPQAVVTGKGGITLYSGAIDNTYKMSDKKSARTTARYLRDALEAISSGKAVTVPVTNPSGNPIISSKS